MEEKKSKAPDLLVLKVRIVVSGQTEKTSLLGKKSVSNRVPLFEKIYIISLNDLINEKSSITIKPNAYPDTQIEYSPSSGKTVARAMGLPSSLKNQRSDGVTLQKYPKKVIERLKKLILDKNWSIEFYSGIDKQEFMAKKWGYVGILKTPELKKEIDNADLEVLIEDIEKYESKGFLDKLLS